MSIITPSRSTFIAGLSILVIGLMLAGNGVALATDNTDSNETIKGLRKKRVEILADIEKSLMARYSQGFIPVELVLDARMSLFRARLELCESKEGRIKVANDFVADAERLLRVTKQDEQEGRIGQLQAEAQLLEARIALETAKAK